MARVRCIRVLADHVHREVRIGFEPMDRLDLRFQKGDELPIPESGAFSE
jgi:hypothetical protein